MKCFFTTLTPGQGMKHIDVILWTWANEFWSGLYKLVNIINNSKTDDLYLASVRPREGSTVEADCILGLYPHDQQNWTNKKKTKKQKTPSWDSVLGFLVPKCPIQILLVPDPREKVHPQRRTPKEPIPNSLCSLLWGSLCWEAYPYLICFSILYLKLYLKY